MKAVSLTQPWATLVAAGIKKIETRSWATSHRGPLAIHATGSFPAEARELCLGEPFLAALERAGVKSPPDLPLGAVLAVCRLEAVWRIEKEHWIPQDQAPFGDFTPGRFAWDLKDIDCFPEPIPASGRPGIWDWLPPVGSPLREIF